MKEPLKSSYTIYQDKSKKDEYYLTGTLLEFDKISTNGHIYSKEVMMEALKRFKQDVDDGNHLTMGVIQNGYQDPKIDPFKASHRVIALEINDKDVTGVLKPLDNPTGTLLKALMFEKIPIWASYGIAGKLDGNNITEITNIRINVSTDLTGGTL